MSRSTPSERTPTSAPRDRARRLRRDSTIPERLLWGLLRDRRLGGFKFCRQFPVDPFIVDFVCEEARVIVELDGMSHVGTGVKDDKRTSFLKMRGYSVVRLTNDDVIQNRAEVGEYLFDRVRSRRQKTAPSPLPSPGRPPALALRRTGRGGGA